MASKRASYIPPEVQKEKECRFCHQPFEDPRLLPCMHTLCHKCVEKVAAKAASCRVTTCPFCRQTFDADGLPFNDAVEILSKTPPPQGASMSTCTSHPKQQVSGFCDDCDTIVCPTCVSTSGHSTHLIADLADLSSYEVTIKLGMLQLPAARLHGRMKDLVSDEVPEDVVKILTERQNALTTEIHAAFKALQQQKPDLADQLQARSDAVVALVAHELQPSVANTTAKDMIVTISRQAEIMGSKKYVSITPLSNQLSIHKLTNARLLPYQNITAPIIKVLVADTLHFHIQPDPWAIASVSDIGILVRG